MPQKKPIGGWMEGIHVSKEDLTSSDGAKDAGIPQQNWIRVMHVKPKVPHIALKPEN